MTPAEMQARIKTLEGHRDQWRRIAWRALDELEKHDKETATAIIDGSSLTTSEEGRKT